MSSAATQFDGIFHGLSPELGKFRVATSGMAWKGEQGEQVVAMATADIKWAQWLRVARNFQLRVGLKDRKREVFDGFMREDHEKLASILKQHFSITLETKDVTFKGWNWGVTDIQGQDLAFLVSNKTAFEVQLGQVANSNIAGRTEVSLEFTANPATKSKSSPDELSEIRFYVPGTHSKAARASDAGSQQSGADDDDEETSAAQAFHDAIKEKADISQVTGDLVLSFEEVLVLTPRGRYDVDMFLDFLRLRGKTYDYKILYSSISRLFLLPKDDQHVLFILSLTTPIRQGQTRYHYLVMQFTQEEEITAELNMSEEDVAKYDKLKKHYEDPTYEVVSGVFRALAKKKLIGAGSFQSHDGHAGIKANLKAVQGDLFLLEKFIFFVSKQPTLIELSDIQQVVYSRVGANMGTAGRTFDLKIVTKSGPEFTFTSINKEEHEASEAYLKDKKIRIKNEMVPDADLLMAVAGGDDDDDDDDDDAEMRSVDGSDDVPRVRAGGPDADSSEEDEDFQASESDAGSPSESDSSDSGGETASDASGDRELTNAAKSKAKAKAKGKIKSKAKAKETAGSNADDDDDDDPGSPKKPAAKKAKGSSGGEAPKKKPAVKKAKNASDDDEEEEKPKKAPPRPKPKPKKDLSDGDGEGSSSKPKPKAKSKAKETSDAMDVDDDGNKKPAPARPKPKPVVKDKAKDGGKDERPMKKQKTID